MEKLINQEWFNNIENSSKEFILSLKNQNDYKLTYEYDDFDRMCWPNASSGFFKFKKKIPFFLNEILKN